MLNFPLVEHIILNVITHEDIDGLTIAQANALTTQLRRARMTLQKREYLGHSFPSQNKDIFEIILEEQSFHLLGMDILNLSIFW